MSTIWALSFGRTRSGIWWSCGLAWTVWFSGSRRRSTLEPRPLCSDWSLQKFVPLDVRNQTGNLSPQSLVDWWPNLNYDHLKVEPKCRWRSRSADQSRRSRFQTTVGTEPLRWDCKRDYHQRKFCFPLVLDSPYRWRLEPARMDLGYRLHDQATYLIYQVTVLRSGSGSLEWNRTQSCLGYHGTFIVLRGAFAFSYDHLRAQHRGRTCLLPPMASACSWYRPHLSSGLSLGLTQSRSSHSTFWVAGLTGYLRAPKEQLGRRYSAEERWDAHSDSQNWRLLFEFSRYLLELGLNFRWTAIMLSVTMLFDCNRSWIRAEPGMIAKSCLRNWRAKHRQSSGC